MPTVADVVSRLDRAAPASAAASWDPVGVQLGDPNASVSTVAVCHEITDIVVGRVAADPPDLVITYHPLLFRPTTRIVAGPGANGRAFRMLAAGAAVAVVHTAFDTAAGGTADALAAALGLSGVRPFGPAGPTPSHKVVTFVPADAVDDVVAAMTGAGAGQIGNYAGCHFRSDGTGGFVAEAGARPQAGEMGANQVDEVRIEMVTSASVRDRVVAALVATHPYEEPAFDVYETVSNERFIGRYGKFEGSFDSLVERAGGLGHQSGLRVTRAPGAHDLVAVVPGSGSSFIAAAAAVADVLVTGDVDHHRAVEARDRGLSVIDPGHAATERPGMKALLDVVRTACPDLSVVDMTDDDPTPWR